MLILGSLQNIHSNCTILCPLCRNVLVHLGDVSALPNNGFALHILQLKQKHAKKAVTPNSQPTKYQHNQNSHYQTSIKTNIFSYRRRWCLTCGSFATSDCNTEAHSCIDMSSVSLKNFEALLSLRNDLERKVKESQTRLVEAINKRREVQDYLTQLSKALKLFTTEVDCLEEENNLLLAELISLLEGHKSSSSSGQGREEPCLSELVSLFDDCSSQDTIETLREKLDKKYKPQYEEKLTLTADRFTELKKQKKTRITISLLDETNNLIPTCKLFRDGFSLDHPGSASMTTKIDLLLLSHIAHSINTRVLLQREIPREQGTVHAASSLPHSLPAVRTKEPVIKLNISLSHRLILGQQLMLHIVNRKNGHLVYNVCIDQRLPVDDSPYFRFVQQLRECCFLTSLSSIKCLAVTKSSKVWKVFNKCIRSTIIKIYNFISLFQAVPGLLLEIPFAPELFQPIVPGLTNNLFPISDDINLPVRTEGDVGLTLITTKDSCIITGWNLIFPGQHFQDPKYSCHIKSIPPAYPFGRISKTDMECINKLMVIKKNERNDFTFFLGH